MTSNGSSRNTAVGDIVTVSVSGDGPFGLILQPDSDGCAAVIRSWARLPNGKFGAVQKNGGVHLGDVLIAINDTKLSDMPYSEVTALLSNRNILQKSLKFQKYDEYARQKKGTRRQSSALGSTKESKNQFLSVIRQSRINNFTSAKFVEYEVVCQLRLSSGQIEKDKVFKWSVWKRYSDFEQLHGLLRQSLGWHMESIEFPSPHNFVMNKFAPDFTEQRREDLNRYWQRVIGIDKIAEFNKHHCSEALKLFLDVEGALRGGGEKPSGEEVEVMDGEGEANAEGAVPTAKKSGASSRRLSTRASSKKLSGRRGSTTGNTTAPSDDDPCASNQSVPPPTSSSTPAAAPAAVASAGAPPPPPPPRAPPPCGPPSGGGAMPPKATGARMNLLGDINKLRKE